METTAIASQNPVVTTTEISPSQTQSSSSSSSTEKGTGFQRTFEISIQTLNSKQAAPAQANMVKSGTATSDGCGDSFGGLAVNFSFFVRLSGNFSRVGEDVQGLFHQAASTITKMFGQNDGWSGDPVGSFLSASDKALGTSSSQAVSYLDQVLTAAKSGFEGISQALNMHLPSFGGGTDSSNPSSTSTSGSNSFFQTNYGMDIANLQLNAAAESGKNQPPRIPVRNKNGTTLALITNEEAAAMRTAGKQLVSNEATSDDIRSKKFLEAFQKFLADFIRQKDEKPADDSTKPSEVVASTNQNTPSTSTTGAASPTWPPQATLIDTPPSFA